MKKQLQRGRIKYLSFIALDLICLILANLFAVYVYIKYIDNSFSLEEYSTVIIYMAAIDIFVSIVFNTLNLALRRRKVKEIIESFKHVASSFAILAFVLFTIKEGAAYSRVTIYLAYIFYFILIILVRTAWKAVLKTLRSEKEIPTVLLVTTAGYAKEGIDVIQSAGMIVKGMFITDKTNEGSIQDIPVIVSRQDAMAFLCWKWIDRVYICGPHDIDVPKNLIVACKQMGVQIFVAPARKSLDFEIVKIKTAMQKGDNCTGLSFFESEHDIPFQIRRLYAIYESEQEKQKGFHAHKQSWHLLFCPYGSIDVMVDSGKERKIISLSDPATGLIIHPSVWREMMWKKEGSVLCVAASGHYDADKLRDDYSEYVKFLQEKEWSAAVESAEIMGDAFL